ncbi:MAG TPA: DUF952 domain-containing protein [Acetobacteraceae bacterium]|nr:DUF952 domain-containing protein [Acetobacteraceae bacterium]
MTERLAYKVMAADEFAHMQREQVFHGSAVDRADGFIHLSTAAQLTATVDKHFQGQSDLVVVAVDLSPLGDAVRWETSRGGDLFPHVYGALPMSAVTAAGPLVRGADGAVLLPG